MLISRTGTPTEYVKVQETEKAAEALQRTVEPQGDIEKNSPVRSDLTSAAFAILLSLIQSFEIRIHYCITVS
jgi:hypothetical protein